MLERQRSLAAAVTSAMIYPALLLIAAIGSITLLLTDVLPQFVPLFEQNGVALPRPTQILIGIGDRCQRTGCRPAGGHCCSVSQRDRCWRGRAHGCGRTARCYACRWSAR